MNSTYTHTHYKHLGVKSSPTTFPAMLDSQSTFFSPSHAWAHFWSIYGLVMIYRLRKLNENQLCLTEPYKTSSWKFGSRLVSVYPYYTVMAVSLFSTHCLIVPYQFWGRVHWVNILKFVLCEIGWTCENESLTECCYWHELHIFHIPDSFSSIVKLLWTVKKTRLKWPRSPPTFWLYIYIHEALKHSILSWMRM